MRAEKHPLQHGYRYLERDDEVIKRLKAEHKYNSMRQKLTEETFDQWLEVHGHSRKMIYIP